ncbi:MAG: glycosyl hydrolase [Opitutaceae bacterium]|nr:glycosyl hydrolase [Opitutaceae bacterium]
MRIPVLLPLIMFCLTPHSADAALAPANPQASPRTRAVLDFIGSLEARTDKRLLSGQFTDYGTQASLELPEKIHLQTGHWPALIGVDYAEFLDPDDSQKSTLTSRVPNQVAIAYWRAGGLITVNAHLYNPAKPHEGGLRDQGVDLAGLLAPGTAMHQQWMQELDELAAGLQELREAGVVVLWRPFHEMNGGWFWWGKKDPAIFIRVWRHMFDYFTKAKGLDNLLWVYAPNHGDHTADYYPGDGYVDVVGLDVYTDFVDPEHVHGYAEVARLPKPFAFSEYSARVPGKSPPPYDYRQFMPGLMANFPRAIYFMNWNAKWSPANNQHAKELYNHPWVVNREDLPPGLTGGTP